MRRNQNRIPYARLEDSQTINGMALLWTKEAEFRAEGFRYQCRVIKRRYKRLTISTITTKSLPKWRIAVVKSH